MGQCMQQVSAQSYYHPLLGQLHLRTLDGTTYLRTVQQMDSQEIYIFWSKKMNKLRSLSQLRNFLYLPVKESWRGNWAVSSGGELQLFFEPYQLTLFQKVMSHKLQKTYFQQYFLWQLCYTLMKYLNYSKQLDLKQNTLSFQNILVDSQGSIKIITDTMTPHVHSQPEAAHKQEDQQLEFRETATFIWENSRCSLQHIAGIICLSAAAILDISTLQQNNHSEWKKMRQTVRQDAFRKCRERYCGQLTQVLTDMITCSKGDNFAEIIKKIEIFMPQVQLGIYDSVAYKVAEIVDFVLPQQEQKEQKDLEKKQIESVSDCNAKMDAPSTPSTVQANCYEERDFAYYEKSYLTIL